MTVEQELTIRRLGQVGDLGWIVAAHGELYLREFGWDLGFEALTAEIVAGFAREPDPEREAGWIAELDGRRVGCVFCEADREQPGTAKLRLLMVEPAARGRGLGGRLVDVCLEFAAEVGYERIELWTNADLVAAGRVYRSRGFRLESEWTERAFGHDQRWQTYSASL